MKNINLKKYTALVVDDECFIRKELKTQLHEIGFGNVVEAHNGHNAKKVLNNHVDIIFCDIHMHTMNGLEFLKYVRSLGNALRIVPFLLLTAEADLKTVLTAAKLKADAYLLKQLSAEKLKSRVTPLLTQHPAQRVRRFM